MIGNSIRFVSTLNLTLILLTSCGSDPKAELLPQSVNEKPALTLLGESTIVLDVHSEFVDPGFSAQDKEDGNLTDQVEITTDLDPAVIGTFRLDYLVEDSKGASAAATRIVQVVDREIPVINLLGSNPLLVDVGTTFVDPGFDVTDNYDRSLGSQVQVEGSVNTSALSESILTYRVSDSSNNAAVEVTRVVRVVDRTAPVITLLGDNPQSFEAGSGYIPEAVQAIDNFEGDISSRVVTMGTVNYRRVGDVTLTYRVSDTSGNEANAVTRIVRVIDTTAPRINLVGSDYELNYGDLYVEPGFDVVENSDEELRNRVQTRIEGFTDRPGTYTIHYEVADSSGNRGAASRNVTILDRVPPVITLNGESTIEIEAGSTFVDPGATATDNFDGDITSSIRTYNPVRTSSEGTYVIYYDVMDSSGNPATTVNRTVRVTPINICTAADLERLRNLVSASINIVCDIDLSSIENFSPITNLPGNLNGNNHTISNLRINSQDLGLAEGLFRFAQDKTISNLNIVNVQIVTRSTFGALVGSMRGGLIENCAVTGTIDAGTSTGSLVGSAIQTRIINSNADITIRGGSRVGGLVGSLIEGEISDSFSQGNIGQASTLVASASRDYIGGLAGSIQQSRIQRSFSSATMTGIRFVGGLVGSADYFSATRSIVEDVFASGNVTGQTIQRITGGLFGYANGITLNRALYLGRTQIYYGMTNPIFGVGPNSNYEINEVFWNRDQFTGGSLQFGAGLTTTQLQDPATYDDSWDFENVWILESGALPSLR